MPARLVIHVRLKRVLILQRGDLRGGRPRVKPERLQPRHFGQFGVLACFVVSDGFRGHMRGRMKPRVGAMHAQRRRFVIMSHARFPFTPGAAFAFFGFGFTPDFASAASRIALSLAILARSAF